MEYNTRVQEREEQVEKAEECSVASHDTTPCAGGVCDDDELQRKRKQKRGGVLVHRA